MRRRGGGRGHTGRRQARLAGWLAGRATADIDLYSHRLSASLKGSNLAPVIPAWIIRAISGCPLIQTVHWVTLVILLASPTISSVDPYPPTLSHTHTPSPRPPYNRSYH